MVSEFLSGMTRTSPKPHLMGLSVTNKPLIDEVNYQFARRILYVASTTFLAGSDFMELRDAHAPSYRVTDLVARYLSRPSIAERPFTSTEFDPSLLWDHRLEFLLQFSFPEMYFTSVYVDPMCPCLIDTASETMLVFRPGEQQGEWLVEIKGYEQLWNKVTQAYRWWVETGSADLDAYRLEIDASGKLHVVLASKVSVY